MSAKSKEIAIFPLNIFLLPGECIELHIFEERYKQLINDCLEGDPHFGIVFSHEDNTGNLGSLVKLEEIVNRYPDGEMDILVRSVSVFKMEEYFAQFAEKLYPGGVVKQLFRSDNFRPGPLLTDEVNKYLLRFSAFPINLFDGEEDFNLFDIANELNMDDSDKLTLIMSEKPEKMEKFLKNYLRYLNLLQDQEKSVFKDIYLN